jgi:hypothetical protein
MVMALMVFVLLWAVLSMMNALPTSHTPAGIAERFGSGITVWIVRWWRSNM